MSRSCTLCDKRPARANSVSHSMRRVPRTQKPNLQSIKIEGQSMKVCSSCRRTLSKTK